MSKLKIVSFNILAAREDGGQNLVRLRGGEDEHHVRGRFLQGLEQCIERFLGEHVHLVNVNDAVLPAGGGELHVVAQVADVIDTAVGSTVDFQHIQAAPLGNFLAHVLIRVEIHLRAAGAVERLGKDARGGGLARAARPHKEVGVRKAFLFNGVAQRAHNMIMAQHILERAGTVFSGKNLVAHAQYCT